jgi:hypothetical protein
MQKIKSICLIIAGSMIFLGCQSQNMPSMPWQRSQNTHPPVELLDDTPTGTPAPPVQEGLGLSPTQRFKDVPLPDGVRADNDRSYIYEDATLEIGRMVYTSRSSVNELAQFYIQQCPAAGWTLDRVLQAEGAHLHFSKPGKRLEVIIRSLGVGRSQELILHLTPDRRGMN